MMKTNLSTTRAPHASAMDRMSMGMMGMIMPGPGGVDPCAAGNEVPTAI
jgi:hypothetical protein